MQSIAYYHWYGVAQLLLKLKLPNIYIMEEGGFDFPVKSTKQHDWTLGEAVQSLET